ncbi:MAG: NAD(P)-binding domain-containing protein [Bryobacteraceae bacterium]|jgi:thioredoxin reductase
MINHSLGCQFTVIGAGPYGLAAASHLRAAGAEVRIFGTPMDFWASQMPRGMLLRSPWSGSNIGDPDQTFTLDRYESALGLKLDRRVPLEDFVRYGQWFQRQTLPDLDARNIAWVERGGSGYRITFDDGEQLCSRNVVVATGIGSFSNCPAVFASLPAELVSHTSHRLNHNLSRFARKKVVVVGGGQSAIESAALLHEAGAQVEVLLRQPSVCWLNTRPLIEWLMDCKINPFKAPGKIGPAGVNWLIEHPALFTTLSRKLQDAMTFRAIRPAASSWLRARTDQLTITAGRHAAHATVRGGKVHLRLNDRDERTVDHVLLGTGYKVDIARCGILSAELLQRVRTVNGYPVLNGGFESSLAGLYFVGATAAYSFGPLLRFVAGTQYAARALSRYGVRISESRTLVRRPLILEPSKRGQLRVKSCNTEGVRPGR